MNESTIIQDLVLRLQVGDKAARAELLDAACVRLQVLAKQMKADFPAVARWEETDDIYQSAMIRLCRALEDVKPNDARHFFRLAAMQIRRQLLDLARKHSGAQGLARNHESIGGLRRPDDSRPSPLDPSDESLNPQSIQKWTELHEAVEKLDEQQREVFELMWYHELGHDEIAPLLGVTPRTVRRRWLGARLKLHELLVAEEPIEKTIGRE